MKTQREEKCVGKGEGAGVTGRGKNWVGRAARLGVGLDTGEVIGKQKWPTPTIFDFLLKKLSQDKDKGAGS